MRQFLVEELELAGVRVQGDHRACVEVVAGARALGLPVRAAPVIERRRIGGAPPHRVGLGVVGAGHPAAAAAGAPALIAPGLHRLVIGGDGEEFPQLLAGLGVDAEDRAAAGPLAALAADDDLVLDEERRTGEADGELLGVDQLGVPGRRAGLHVERDQPSVDRADIEVAAAHGHAAVVGRVGLAGDQILVELGRVGPLDFAGGAVERIDLAVGAGIVEHAIDRQRHRLDAAGRAAGLMDPRHLQLTDIFCVDLIELAMVPAVEAAVIGQPIAGILFRMKYLVEADVVGTRRSRDGDHRDYCETGSRQKSHPAQAHRGYPPSAYSRCGSPRLHRSGSSGPRDRKRRGAARRVVQDLRRCQKQIHAPQTANTSFDTIPRGSAGSRSW